MLNLMMKDVKNCRCQRGCTENFTILELTHAREVFYRCQDEVEVSNYLIHYLYSNNPTLLQNPETQLVYKIGSKAVCSTQLVYKTSSSRERR